MNVTHYYKMIIMKNSLSLFVALLLIPVHASFSSDNAMRDDEATPSSSSSLAGKSQVRSPHSIDRETSGPASKKRRLDDGGISLEEFKQTYAIPTYDATFKYVMNNRDVCLSFLQTFIPDEQLASIKHLDDHLRPFKEYTQARSLLNDAKTKNVIKKVNSLIEDGTGADNFKILYKEDEDVDEQYLSNGGWVIKSLAENYGDILSGYPKPERNSQVDLICQTDGGDFTFVEVQVIPQDFWDQRALAYAASLYSRQLKEGEKWGEIHKVISLNILGGGLHNTKWKRKSSFKKFTFKDQDNVEIEDGIEVLQYPLFHQETRDEGEKQLHAEESKNTFREWMDFFEGAHTKKKQEVDALKSEAVKKAYEMIMTKNLPKGVKKEYDEQAKEFFAPYSQHIEEEKETARKEGIAEGLAEGEARGMEKGREEEKVSLAKKLLEMGQGVEFVSKATGLRGEEIEKLCK